VTSALSVTVMLISGVMIGWRIHSTPQEALAGVGLLLLFSVGMLWAGLLLGLVVGDAEAVSGIGFIILYPLILISNALVPVGTLPDALRAIAEYNPLSAVATAMRQLFGNPKAIPPDAAWPLVHPIAASLLYVSALLLVAIPLATRRYGTRTSN